MACSQIPPEAKPYCEKFLKSLHQVVVLLKKGTAPHQVCVTIQMCDKESSDVFGGTSAKFPSLNFASLLKTLTPANVCRFCEILSEQVKKALDAGMTEEQIRSALTTGCSQMPPEAKPYCEKFVKSLHQIVVLLKKGTAPHQICVTIQMCDKESSDVFGGTSAKSPGLNTASMMKNLIGPRNGKVCDICKSLVEQAKKYVTQGKAEKVISKLLDVYCKKFRVLSGECRKIVHKFLHKILKQLAKKIDTGKICKSIGLCKKMDCIKTMSLKFVSLTKRASVVTPCQFCEPVALQVKKLLATGSTEEQIRSMVKFTCVQDLPPDVKKSCQKFLKALHQVVVLIKKGTAPHQVCVTIQMCDKETDGKTGPEASLLFKENHAQEGSENPTLCPICEMLVKTAKEMVTANKTKEEIENALLGECTKLSVLESECKDLVRKYIPQILDLLAKSVDVRKVCETIGLCDSLSGNNENWTPLKKARGILHIPVNDDLSCKFCEPNAFQVKSMLDAGMTEEQIRSALAIACSRVRPELKPYCQKFAKSLHQVVELVKKGTSPHQTCVTIQMCDKEFEGETASQPAALFKENDVAQKEDGHLKILFTASGYCTMGSRYWCRSTSTARMCGKQAFCRRFLWRDGWAKSKL